MNLLIRQMFWHKIQANNRLNLNKCKNLTIFLIGKTDWWHKNFNNAMIYVIFSEKITILF